jgi:phosphatidylinositol alpha-1,6-mannosyltransferase
MVGGAEILLLEVYRRLATQHEVCLLTADKKLSPSGLDHLVNFSVVRYRDRFSFMNLRGHRLTGGIMPPFSLSAVRATQEAIADFNPHVINAHYMAHTGLAAVIAQKKHGVPSVLTFSGRDVPGPRTPWLWKYYDRWVASSIAWVTFISRYCRQAIYGMNSTTGTIIPGGVDLERFSPGYNAVSLRHSLDIPSDAPVLFAMQRLSLEKRVDVLVRAMPHVLMKHPKAILVLGGTGKARPQLVTLVKKLGLSSSIRLTGYISDEDLPHYYALCDVFVFHSTYETFGLVLAEAMASGKPIVSVQSTAIPEIVRDGQNGVLVPPLDSRAMAEMIVHLLNSPHERERLGGNARTWAEQHFDWDHVARQYEAVLLRAAAYE